MANSIEHSVYVFDDFRLDRARLMLYRGEAEVALPPKAVETLAVLVSSRGEIVSKDELIEAVWTDSIVEESNLSQYLYLLRKTLGTRPDGTAYIETLRRRGYRFTSEVRAFTEISRHEGDHSDHAPRERRAVERRGNVLALVDWQEPEAAEAPVPATTKPPEPQTAARSRWLGVSAIGLISISVLVGLSAFFFFKRSGVSEQEEAFVEQDILRLTNGIEVMDATISPDGKYFVYHEPDGKLYRMWLQQTGHSTRHEIVPASERVPSTKTFTPDGQYIYFLATNTVGEAGSLYRVPTLGGPVTKILDQMQTGVSFSPDGQRMVYYRNDKEGARFVTNASDGSEVEKLLHSATPGNGVAAWSPDGRMIAITLSKNPENLADGCYLAVVELETRSLTKLSDEVWGACVRMEWEPNGRGLYMIGTRMEDGMTTRRDQVFHISYPQGKSRRITSDGSRYQHMSLGVTNDGAVLAVPFNRSSQIFAMSPNGESRTATQITTGLADGRAGIAPLADGRVAYISRIGENLNVFVVNQDGSNQVQITDNSHAIEELRSGGDGRYLVYSGYSDYPRPHLFRMNIDGGEMVQITAGEGREIDSTFSNDGRWIAYDSSIVVDGKSESSIWKQSLDTGERISLNRKDCQMPHFSPDDKYISCVREQKDILIMNSTDGSLIRTLRVPQAVTVSNSINFGARWTPDGKSVAYIVNDKGVSNIWTHPIDGGAPKRLTDFTAGSIYHFAYSLDSQRLFVARGYQIRDAILLQEKR